MIDRGLRAAVDDWIRADPHGGDRAELTALLDAGAAAELRARFAGPLQFGTAGLRGPLRAGPNGMNLAVVRRTTAGLASWLRRHGGDGVVVGYDARHRSAEFAHDAAATLTALGMQVWLADRAWPTPCTAFAVRWCGAGAAVQITASHNPASDSGYKVYDATGAQIVPPIDAEIASAIDAQPPARDLATVPVQPDLGDELLDAYCTTARCVLQGNAREVAIVYTPLHGVGASLATRLLHDAGFERVALVAGEARPDPDFPGLPFPNPEEPGALDAAFALAGPDDLVLANDPDADRLAVAVPSPLHGRRRLSGDELGTLLGEARLAATTGPRVVARSAVSARALDAAARVHGAECVVTPTGFKWLARAADGRDAPLVFAYEEALGYAVTDAVRDKDGLTALLLTAELAAGEPLLDRLARVAVRDGLFVTAQWSPRFDGANGPERMQVVLDTLGTAPGDPIELPGGRARVRPSGTEPKLKCYFETALELEGPSAPAYEERRAEGLATCEGMRTALAARLGLLS
jgi:phosphomannomutase